MRSSATSANPTENPETRHTHQGYRCCLASQFTRSIHARTFATPLLMWAAVYLCQGPVQQPLLMPWWPWQPRLVLQVQHCHHHLQCHHLYFTTFMVTMIDCGANDQARKSGKQIQNGLGGIQGRKEQGGRQHVMNFVCVGLLPQCSNIK